MFKIKVADIVINYTSHHKDFFSHRLKNYLYSGAEQGIDIRYSFEEKIELPKHEVVGKVHDATLGRLENGNNIMYLKSNKTGKVFNYTQHNSDFSFIDSHCVHIKTTDEVRLTDLDREYLKSGLMFNDRLIFEGGTCLHGSCIAYRGKGLIFSAPCGTGKSTHTSLWKKLYGEDVVYVNDDKPALREKDGTIYVYGTPWSGKTELNTNISVPLSAVVFLARGENNKIRRLSVPEAVCYLNDQTFPSVYDNRLFKMNMDFIEKIISKVPVYMLECDISEEAVNLVKKTIFKGEV